MMHKPICWIVRQDDGIRREVEAMVARQRVTWKIRLSSTRNERYASAKPCDADWDELLQKILARYQRHNVSYGDVELVTRLHHKRAPSPHLPNSTGV